MRKFVLAGLVAALAALCGGECLAQGSSTQSEEKVVTFNEKVHDFGDILVSDKSVSCVFVFTNISDKPVVVHNVVSSCGCTTPEWTKSPVKPGEKGNIKVTFKNDQGAYPFNKSITAYISGVNRPVVLKIKGAVYGKKMPVKDIYTNTIGGVLGLKEKSLLVGNTYQGKAKSDVATIANISKKAVRVEIVSDNPALTMVVTPNPVPAGEKASLSYTVNTALGPKLWGASEYTARFVIDGVEAEEKIAVHAIIADNFEGWTQSQIGKAAVPTIEVGYLELGTIAGNSTHSHTIAIKNTGKSNLTIYKADAEEGITVLTPCPVSVAAGKTANVRIKFEPATLPEGEFVKILTFTTNSPTRPRLDFFVNGTIEK